MGALERISKHFEGLEHFRRGEFSEAIEIFSDAQLVYGSHVSLLADLASAYFLQGDVQAAQNICGVLEEEYRHAEPLLSEKNHVETLIFISKMRAARGEAESALNALESALEYAEGNKALQDGVQVEIERLQSIKLLP